MHLSRLKGFTLLELLLVIAILAILAAVAVYVLNPGEYLRQARDTRRLSELESISDVLAALELNSSVNFGSSSVVYISLPDSSLTCANHTLPTLPSGWSYHCSPSSTLQRVDGTGWIPVDFRKAPGGSPYGGLPVDPINEASGGKYYTYMTGGSYELTALAEANKSRESAGIAVTDEGDHNYTLEAGSDKHLTPAKVQARSEDSALQTGLVGWWSFDEGSGTAAKDFSLTGNDGTLITDGGAVATWTTGKVGKALRFGPPGTNYNGVQIADTSSLKFISSDFSIVAWVNNYVSYSINDWRPIVCKCGSSGSIIPFIFDVNANAGSGLMRSDMSAASPSKRASGQTGQPVNTWYFMAFTRNGADGTVGRIYRNGVYESSGGWDAAALADTTDPVRIGSSAGLARWWDGMIDEVRIYNRALTAAEVKALYDATK